jgi:endonuclease/exonuclease/phosphatase family metal-dependent hydrolase
VSAPPRTRQVERRVRELDLLSWNVHGPPFAPRRAQRLAAVAAELERRAPEVALLQEVWFAADAAALGRRLAGRYRMVDGAPRSGPMRVGGLLAFVRGDAAWRPVGDARFERYAACAARWRVWEGDGLIGKGIQVMSLVADDGGHGLTILHTHVQAQYNAVAHRRPRAGQLAQLAALAAGLDPATPVLAAGDLNTGPEESLYRDLLAPTWLDLTTATRAARPAAQTQFECGAEPLWIDYVLARRSPSWTVEADLELVENTARDEPFSDHNGLHARLRLRRA